MPIKYCTPRERIALARALLIVKEQIAMYKRKDVYIIVEFKTSRPD